MMTKAEKEELFRGLDRVVAILSFHFDEIWKVAQQDGLPGFHEVLDTLTCNQCNAKLLGLCAGEGHKKNGVLKCMESKDMQLHNWYISMN